MAVASLRGGFQCKTCRDKVLVQSSESVSGWQIETRLGASGKCVGRLQHSAIGYHRELRPFDTITIQILRILEQAIFNSITHLERLLANFDKLSVAAIGLSSPNKEDDEFIRCGMIGFAHSSSLENWTIDHFRYVRRIRDEMMPLEFTVNWRRFACLASGYFLGMYVAELLDNAGLRLAEAQTPGFMWLHAESFGDE